METSISRLRIQSLENQEVELETKQAFLLEVKDNGKGIPKESLPKIFDRFYHSEHESDSKLHTGAGIGLSYIKDLVKTHKGTISVTSEPLSETIFKVHLPFIQECDQKSTKDSLASQGTFSEDIYSAVSDLSKSLTRETKTLPVVPDNE